VIVIDTSAVVAILLGEPGAEDLAEQIEQGSPRLISAASYLEAAIVIESRKGDDGARDLDLLIYRAGIEIVAVDAEQAELARVAWRRYGKGRDPAALNYGDCFAYGLAKAHGARLIYRGDDFSRTDLA
jgi:ribonuclease VapC